MTCSNCTDADLGRICPHQSPEELLQLVDAYRAEDHRHMRERDAYRGVLRDLIAELREHCREPSCNCDIGQAADYAETRLRMSR